MLAKKSGVCGGCSQFLTLRHVTGYSLLPHVAGDLLLKWIFGLGYMKDHVEKGVYEPKRWVGH